MLPHILYVFLLLVCVSCSTEKNTSKSRWWHSFTAKYNTYYNGSLAYIDASLEKEKGNRDNFTEMIPLYTVSNKNSREIGKGNYERAIEKSQKAIKQHSITQRPEWNKSRKKTERDIEWLNRKEYNPFLWKAWMLMGRSQFHKGDFSDAASTFAYMSRLYATQPAIYGKARAWLAKCYIEQDWIYDAEDVIKKMKRDSLDWRAVKEWNYTYADYYIHTGRFEEAIPYLRKVIKHEKRKKQKAREWFLMGQLQSALGHKELAYKAFKKVIAQNPPYELEFNARIAMTEVMAGGRQKQMISRLKRMAASDKNKDFLDQVYYAIGNIYLSQRDTLSAISAYEKGNEKATRSGIEKGVLLLHLGDLYWVKEKFADAQRCYGEAIGLLDKDRDDYEQLSNRSKILDELVPHTEAIHLQDSLQQLAKMSEADRNDAIDRVIEALKKKEKEERDRLAEAEANEMLQQQEATGNRTQRQNTNQTPQNTAQQNGLWYFYNPMAVSQGKTNFQKQWGKRENVDNWQRINKTVVASENSNMEEMTDVMRDSLATAQAVEDSLKQITDSAQNDPHKREYYLAQIPFSEEQVQASNLLIMDGLYQSGVIFKDKLDMLHLSERQFLRLNNQYPEFEHNDDVFYHLFLLYSRQGDHEHAAQYLQRLQTDFPESQWTSLLSDPYYEENARFGTHMEDSLYAATYEAFRKDRITEVMQNALLSKNRFPMGAHRDKFIFIDGLSRLNNGDAKTCLENMNEVVEKYPQSDVSTMAGMIINGVKAGRKLHGGKFDMENVWERRSAVLNDSDSIAAAKFTVERNDRFVFLIVYQPDSLNENQLLFELARYNFTNYLVRNFDIEIEDQDDLRRMIMSGFLSYDEALQYARQLHAYTPVAELLQNARTILISEPNLELLGTNFSYADYEEFYEQHFLPLKISTVRLLTEPAEIEYEPQPEPEIQEGQPADDQLFNGGVIDDNTLIDLGIDTNAQPQDDGSVVLPEEPTKPVNGNDDGSILLPDEPTTPVNGNDDGSILLPDEPTKPVNGNDDGSILLPDEPTTPVNGSDDGSILLPDEQGQPVKPVTKPVTPTKPATTGKQETKPSVTGKQETKPSATGKTATKPAKPVAKPKQAPPKQTKQIPDLEDEYYELEGF